MSIAVETLIDPLYLVWPSNKARAVIGIKVEPNKIEAKIIPNLFVEPSKKVQGSDDKIFEYISQVAVTYDIWFLIQSVIKKGSGGAEYIKSLTLQKAKIPILRSKFREMFNFQKFSNLDDQYNYSLFN